MDYCRWTLPECLGSYTRLNLDHKRYVPNDIQQGRINGNGWAYIHNMKRTDIMATSN